MNGLSLCSGIGGLDLGLHIAVPQYRTICYVEIEPFAQDILLARMADGFLDRAPLWGDLKQFDGRPWRGLVDLIHGGFPCQPVSKAGRRRGSADAKWLWNDVARIVRDVDPEWAFFENVPGLLHHGMADCLKDLSEIGFDAAWGVFSAFECGAPHIRERLFLLAHSSRQRDGMEARPVQAGWKVAEPCTWWNAEPELGRVAHGLPHRVDRLKALGNAVVPAVAALAWRTLIAELA